MSQERFQFKAEIQQLLNILVHSLYTEREIFLRELISNAADALNRLQFEMLTEREVLDPTAELAIRLSVDGGDGAERPATITVADSGIGMTRQEAIENLGTIAQSGAAAFLERLKEARAGQPESDKGAAQEAPPALEMIGQFGVGFYSAFMVARRVRVVSRSYLPDAEAVEWVSDGSATFEVRPADKADRGTEVIVELNEDAAEFASDWRLEQIVKRHSDFVAYPIYVGDRVVNRQKPLWRQRPSEVEEQEYKDFFKHLSLAIGGNFSKDPLLVSHLVTDVPVDIRSILYVPGRRPPGPLDLRADYGLRLYARGVLIQADNKDLLPSYLRFVEGVVESEDLPLNVSRETVQRNPAARRIQRALVGRLLRELGDLAEKEPDKYRRFWNEFGIYLKEGVATDLSAREELLPFLRFHSSRTEKDGLTSLAEYAGRMVDEQPAIYYLLGEDLDSIARSPHLDYFQANDVEVLYLVDPVDAFMMMALHEYEDKPADVVYPIKNIDDASLELPPAKKADEEGDQEGKPQQETIPDEQFGKLVGRLMTTLGARVTQVRESRVLRDHPCRLVTPEDAPGRELQRVYRLMNQEYEVPARILEINRRHPLIRNMARMAAARSQDALLDQAIEQLYENQLLLEGLHPNPAAMVARIQGLMEAATAGAPQDG